MTGVTGVDVFACRSCGVLFADRPRDRQKCPACNYGGGQRNYWYRRQTLELDA